MKVHANAPLGPKGRERMVLRVLEQGWSRTGYSPAGPRAVRPPDAETTAPIAMAAPRMPPLGNPCPDLPRGLTDAMRQAIASDPARRQPSMLEFAATLTA